MTAFAPRFKNLVEIYQNAVTSYADRPLFGVKQAGTWQWMTYREFGRRVDALRGALASLGVKRGDRVAMIANNRPEWAIACYATYGLGAQYVPMYESQHDKDWKFILDDCGAKVLFVSTTAIADRIETFRKSIPALEHVVVLEGAGNATRKTFAELLELGAKKPADLVSIDGAEGAGFIYTSGTTGNPKGVLLSHANLASNVSAIHEVFPMSPEDRSLSFLPWAHSFGQTCELHGLISMGSSMGIAEAIEKIIDNIGEVRPTLLFAVPRIFNRIYDGLNKRMAEAGGIKKKMFDEAMAMAALKKQLSAQRKQNGWVDLKLAVLDKLVFSKVRDRFGGRLKYAFSGGAALSKEVAEFIDNVGIMVYEGYGLTETSPIATMNYPGNRKIGSVGKAIPGVTIEIDTSVTDDPKNGEIVVWGHNIMMGYYGLDEENKKVLLEKNGQRGFRTGDMGYIDGEGFLHITGRIKEQYKLLNGKYVVPTPLEEQLKLSPFITNIMVYGDNREHNVALVVPDWDAVKKLAQEQGLPSDPKQLMKNGRVIEKIRMEIDHWSSSFKQFERVKSFTLVEDDFTIENGMLTPSLKLKRRAVMEKFGGDLDKLYAA